MKLKKKIIIGYGVAFVMMSLVVVWAVINLVSLGKATDAILRENYRSILAAENMLDALERQDSGILLLLLGDKADGVSRFRENEALFLEWLARAKDNVTIKGEKELVRSLESVYNKYRGFFSRLTDLHDGWSTDRNDFPEKYPNPANALFLEVRKTCIELRRINEEAMYAASKKAHRVAQHAIWSTILVGTSALMAALIFSLLLAERIVRPLVRIMEASRRISSGDYAVAVPVETRDELGHLAREFNRMAAELSHYEDLNIEKIISEKNKSEAILSSIEDGILVFDTGLRATGINPAGRRMLGLEFTDIATLKCTDIVPDAHVCEIIRKTVEMGLQPELPDEQRIITIFEKGLSRHYLFCVTAIHGKDKTLSGIVLLLRDITRLKEVERLKSEFIMAASHELRTPLTGLGMSVDLLLEHASSKLDDKSRDLLTAAHEEVHRMKALVADLLDLSKIEAGKIDLEFEPVAVGSLFEYVAAVFKNQAEIKGVHLAFDMDKDLPEVRADATKMTWVLTNLVSNALRYVSRNGHIRLSAQRIGHHVHLTVRDDGPGIPPAYQTKIFEKFVQIKGRETAGTGLGLAICKEIVRAHGGGIWVESNPEKGSAFTFTLPAFDRRTA
jgi:two-component system, NtrC family, sensor histidine kinase KinB